MPARLHPGVYVEEVPSGARAIEAVGTSTCIFVGETERGPLVPTKVQGRLDYERQFGGYVRHDSQAAASYARLPIKYAMDAFFANGGTTAYVLRAFEPGVTWEAGGRNLGPNVNIVAASKGAWSSRPPGGEKRLEVVSLETADRDPDRFRLVVIYTSPDQRQKYPVADVRRVVENWDKLSTDPADENFVVNVLARSLFIRWPAGQAPARPTIFDTGIPNYPRSSDREILEYFLPSPGNPAPNPDSDVTGGRGGDSGVPGSAYQPLLRLLDEITDASLLVIPEDPLPPAPSTPAGTPPPTTPTTSPLEKDKYDAGSGYVDSRPQLDLFYISSLSRHNGHPTTTDAVDAAVKEFEPRARSEYVASYWPWIRISDPIGAGSDPTVWTSPSGFAAGVYARTDARRGVWKAPAGVDAVLTGVRTLEHNVLDSHQDDLNPLGINALRVQPAAGPVIWGARTTKPSSEWRYVPVRRTAMFLRKSIYNGIQWAVFEPNDEPLWAALRMTIGAFMEQQFRQGAFAGKTSREAYFVKCDAETTTEADRAAGIVNILVGFAPLRPAEFVVVKLSQMVNQKA